LCFEGTLNGHVFVFFLEHFLCPLLKPGQWVVMDNARAHHVAEVQECIEQTGAHLLYLPPYSPEYNPIELAWSVAKQKLRTLNARAKEALYEAWSIALEAISPDHAKQFFQHTRKVST
jgi:transposase